MRNGFALFAVILVLCSGCLTIDSTAANRDPNFLITESPDIDEPYEPMGFIRAELFGWYFFAYLPIFSVTLDELIWDGIVAEAKKRGADGVINLKYDLEPPSLWRFTMLGALPFPDWSSKAVATGMAIKRKKPARSGPAKKGGK